MVENMQSPQRRIIVDDQIIPGFKDLFDGLRPSLIAWDILFYHSLMFYEHPELTAPPPVIPEGGIAVKLSKIKY
jgi:hypothetical protein